MPIQTSSPLLSSLNPFFSPRAPPPPLLLLLRRRPSNSPSKPLSFPLLRAANNGADRVPELELLGKPSPILSPDAEESPRENPTTNEALAPFLKFFKDKDPDFEDVDEEEELGSSKDSVFDEDEAVEERSRMVAVEYYDPKPGDLAVGVVVSGNENKLDINVGADALGTMLTKEVLPLYDEELPYLLFDLEEGKDGVLVPGKMGIVKDNEALGWKKVPGRPVVEVGTILFSEVLGRTLSGRPLLSSRRLFRRVAWHRVRQIKQLNEPIEVKIFEWNTGGLLTRIEGLRAFLPKGELMSRVNNFMDLKQNVGRRISVCISKLDEAKNDLTISEKEAWDMTYLKEGTLLEGTVRKIFPYGAQVRIGETNRSGLLHISNITRSRIKSAGDILKVDEKVKVLVVKSMFPDKISFSIADLESEPGLFLSNKEKVYAEAEEMAKRYRKRLPAISPKLGLLPTDISPFEDEAGTFANWKWFKFEQIEEVKDNNNISS